MPNIGTGARRAFTWFVPRPASLVALIALAACGKAAVGTVMPDGGDAEDHAGIPSSDAMPADGTSMDADLWDALAAQDATSDGADDGADDGANTTANDAGLADQASSDAPQDVVPKACGTAVCQAGQACVLVTGGPAPRCEPAGDGGCSPGLVQVASCVIPSSHATVSPGCTDPAPAPGCVDLPDGCADICTCYCNARGGMCVPMSAYLLCGVP